MKKNITQKISIASIAFCIAFPFISNAQSGSLDLSFGSGGTVTTPIGTVGSYGGTVAIQSDGKILTAGYSNNGSNNDFALTRHNIDGSLDLSFDTDGIVTTPIGTGFDLSFSMALQSDGKIVLAGYSQNSSSVREFALVRYNSDGSLDVSFDTDGKVTTPLGTGNSQIYAIGIQSDGKIVVTGYYYSGAYYGIAVVRYNTDGSLDSSFDTDGIVNTTIGTIGDEAYSLAIQSDGKIVVAGYTVNGSQEDLALVRYNTNGSLDTSFDTDGIVTSSIGTTNCYGSSIAFQGDGKIVIGGGSYAGSIYNFALFRYNTNGSLDLSFNIDGIVTTSVGASSGAQSIALQSDGKILSAGFSNNGSDQDFALIRYNANGSLDLSFDTDGIVTTPIDTGNSAAYSLALQNDGKIVVAGGSQIGSIYTFALARYNNDVLSSINEISDQNTDVTIYPNPFSNNITINTKTSLEKSTIKIYSMMGQLVKEINNVSGYNIVLQRDNLESGVYFITLSQENGMLISEKIIVAD